MAGRSEIVQSLLSQGIPDLARTLTLAFGLGLLWLARGLARRKRRAWQLAVALVVATAVTHLVKGLDFEEATVSLAVVAGLWAARRQFVAPGDPESVRPLLQVALALAVIVPIAVLHLDGKVAYSDRVDDTVLILIGALALRALWLWLRPLAERARHFPDERRHAERLVHEHGSDSLAYFALRRDKSTFFSATGTSFLAYRVAGGTAIVGTSATRRTSSRPVSRSKAGRSARCASRSPGSRRPATGSTCCTPVRSARSFGTSSAPSRRSGAVAGPSAASRWRWTPCSSTRIRSSRLREAQTAGWAGSSSSCRRRPVAATRSPRCAAAARHRTG
jgi:hypothetical protein